MKSHKLNLETKEAIKSFCSFKSILGLLRYQSLSYYERNELKERILEISCDRFLKEGFSNVNMDELARELGISKKTIYEHYGSKKELFVSCAEKIVSGHQKQAEELQNRMTKDGDFHFLDEILNLWDTISEHIRLFTPRFVDDLKRYAPETWNFCDKNEAQRKEFFDKVFLMGKKQGFIRENLNKNIFYMMYHNSIFTIMKTEILAELSLNSKQALQMIFEILFKGVLTDFATEEYQKIINNKKKGESN